MAPRTSNVVHHDPAARFSALAISAYRPIAQLADDRRWRGRLTEISINGPGEVWVRVAGTGYQQLKPKEAGFATIDTIMNVCQLIAANRGIKFSPEMPILAVRTPDGNRFHAVMGDNVVSGMALSIRLKRLMETSWDHFEVDDERRDRLIETVREGGAILLSGGTGTGKTTFLNHLCKHLHPDDRVITVEDVQEVDLGHHPHKVQFEVSRTESTSRVGWIELLDSVIRMNPDVIIPGEVSIDNAHRVVHAMDLGHDSVMTTMHSNSPLEAIRGLRRRVALAGGAGSELDALEDFIAENIAFIAQLTHERHDDDSERRRVSALIEPKALLPRIDDDDRQRWAIGDADARERRLRSRDVLARLVGRGVPPSEVHRAVIQVLEAASLVDDGQADDVELSPEERTLLDAEARGLMMEEGGNEGHDTIRNDC